MSLHGLFHAVTSCWHFKKNEQIPHPSCNVRQITKLTFYCCKCSREFTELAGESEGW